MPVFCLHCSLGPGPPLLPLQKCLSTGIHSSGLVRRDEWWVLFGLLTRLVHRDMGCGCLCLRSLKCQPKIQWSPAEGSPLVMNCLGQVGEGSGPHQHLSCSSHNPERYRNVFNAQSCHHKEENDHFKVPAVPVCLFPVGWCAAGSKDGPQQAPLSAPG